MFFLFIDCDREAINNGTYSVSKLLSDPKKLLTKNRIHFTYVSASTFLFFTVLFYIIYGWDFLYEALLYHFVRKDNRHNHSVYFYMIYQTYD